MLLIAAIISTASVGCSRSTPQQASSGEGALPPLPNEPGDDSSRSEPANLMTERDSRSGDASEAKGWPAPVPPTPLPVASADRKVTMHGAEELDAAEDAMVKPDLQLSRELTPEKLVEFLSACDQDMELIYSGRSGLKSREAEIAETQRIISMKLEASRRLIQHPDASAAQRITGQRGELQSLSHLASGGSLKAAEELEVIAKTGLKSDDPTLASDSRLVLIGFELESLQNGNATAPEKIVALVDEFVPGGTQPDVPALMVMGQARELLSQYGHVDEAKRVREKILAGFADSPDPDVAMMAAKLAGAVQFDGIDKLRAAAIAGRSVELADWSAASQRLIDESRDMMTVQYLATVALELQGSGNDALSAATYEVLKKNFTNPSEALGREVSVAIAAAQARNAVIGTAFDVELPTLGGETIVMSDYHGRIVLMPFWAVEFPASLQLVPNITKLRDEHPRDIAIVGMNLDSRTSDQTGNAKEKLGFPSYHSATAPDAEARNPIVTKFGLVSLPFLVMIDRQGKVADICFTERQLQSSIEKLLTSE